ncbi:MAG TPA: AraC family transcriptional regulator [Puia sp.]
MKEKMPFLLPDYNIRDLADSVNIPAYQLSDYINKELGVNFNDYLNRYRIIYCEEMIHRGPVSELNVKGLALKSGFNSRNALTAAFKKFTGFTPSRYLKGWANLHGPEIIG